MNNFDDIENKTDNLKTIVGIYYDYDKNDFNYIILNIKKEEYIKEVFPEYNMKSTPFIYHESNFRLLISDTSKSFVLTRNGNTDDRPFISVRESDIFIARELLRMQNRKTELDI